MEVWKAQVKMNINKDRIIRLQDNQIRKLEREIKLKDEEISRLKYVLEGAYSKSLIEQYT